MDLNAVKIVCRYCSASNELTTDDRVIDADICCSNCFRKLGLLRDFLDSPPLPARQGAVQAESTADIGLDGMEGAVVRPG